MEEKIRAVHRSPIQTVGHYGPVMVSVAGTIAIAIGGVWVSAPKFDLGNIPWRVVCLLLVGGVGSIGGGLWQIRRQNKLSDVERELDSLRADHNHLKEGYPTLFTHRLIHLAEKEFGLGPFDRISLYRHDSHGVFVLIGRYSENTQFRKRGRSVYSDTQGCIGLAWRNKRCCSKFPPAQDRYDQSQISMGLSRDEVDRLGMRSRHICAHRLDTHDKVPLAVIVIESTKTTNLVESEIEQTISGKVGDDIARFVEICGRFGPDLDYARREGF